MAIISIPSAVKIVDLEWSAPPAVQFNRSELTGKTRTIELGPAERWSASGRLVPVQISDARAVRAFLANMKRPDNVVHLRMTETAQVTVGGRPTTAAVNGAGQLGLTLALDGLQAGVTNLFAGDIITVELFGVDRQAIVLAADLVANGSGQATASLSTPLRRAPADNAAVELSLPFAVMRMRNPLRWKVAPTPIYESPFELEESF